MTMDDSQRRYEEILRNIAARRPFDSKPRGDKIHSPQARALDDINAFDALTQLPQQPYPRILCHGPKSITGTTWSAVVIWYHRKGYHGYQTLFLLGVWAHYADDKIILTAAIRELPYRAPIFDAGVYRVAIANGFHLYYDDDGRPPNPSDRILYQSPYTSQKRLTHRQALSTCLEGWQRDMLSN